MIKESLLKIVCLILIISFNWSGLLAIDETFAFFSNTENSADNIFQAGVLDMTARSGQNNFTPNAENMMHGEQVNRDIYIGKSASSLDLKHNVSFEFIDGDIDLCDQLDLKISYDHYHGPVSEGYINRDMRLTYNGKLSDLVNYTNNDFEIPHPDDEFDTNSSDGIEQWFYYSIILPNDIADSFQGKSCNFNFVYESWQTNFPDSSQGFTDEEKLENTIKVGYWNPQVVLNEFLPNAGVYPEFIELYNKTNSSINLDGFYIIAGNNRIDVNSANTQTYSDGLTTIASSGWLVITAGGDLLDDASGTLILYNPNDVEVDSYTYNVPDYNVNNTPGELNSTSSSSIPIDKSYARIPDGSSNWVDPFPTPGAPNTLENKNIEIISPEVLGTSTDDGTGDEGDPLFDEIGEEDMDMGDFVDPLDTVTPSEDGLNPLDGDDEEEDEDNGDEQEEDINFEIEGEVPPIGKLEDPIITVTPVEDGLEG